MTATPPFDLRAPDGPRVGRRVPLRLLDERGWLPALAAGLLAWFASGPLGWRGMDWPAQDFRSTFFREHGFSIVNFEWYGGHLLPAYSLVSPLVGAFLSPRGLAVVAAAGAAYFFDRLVRASFAARPAQLASWLFAVSTLVDVVIGRTTYLLGVAIGLAALYALLRRRTAVAIVLGVVCSLTSPVAGAFLALAAAAWWWPRRHDRADRWVGIALATAAAIPLLVMRALFSDPGWFPFDRSDFVIVSFSAVALFVVAGPRRRELRVASVLLLLAAFVSLWVHTPLGSNLVRLPVAFVPPLVLAIVGPRRVVTLAATTIAPLVWLWGPAIWTISQVPRAESATSAYFSPVGSFLQAQAVVPTRVEIPMTAWRRETGNLPDNVLLARGWERQVDIGVNSIFYDGTLDAASYRTWLLDNGIRFVALPDASLDPSATAEAALLEQGQPYLKAVWSNPHWRVWEVIGSPGLTGDSQATVTRVDGDHIEVDVRAAGRHLVRVHHGERLEVSEGSACVETDASGWTAIITDQPGRVHLDATWTAHGRTCHR